ncbi:MAG: hypothetical protein GX079_04810 [Tissierellia bacterium]|nr:hypothetical protein [Tissierellia bacterium]
MLKDILKIINEEGYISRPTIARRLNTTEDMVDQGIEKLVQMGYLTQEETGFNCATTCGSCPSAKSCGKEIITTFKISDRALKIK